MNGMPTDEQIEALARIHDPDAFLDDVWTSGERHIQDERQETSLAWATWHLRHPGPLLAALAGAGVLRAEKGNAPSPDHWHKASSVTCGSCPQRRRYVTDWEATA